jgi:uncharacterized protein YbjQ (UPF0145 family)
VRVAVVVVAIATASCASTPRDEHVRFPIHRALEKGQSYKSKVEYDVRLFFGAGKTPAGAQRMATFLANTKANAVGKTDQEACDIAFISAVTQLQAHARREGGNAVVNIKSVYRGENSDSQSEYVCGAGNIMVGVTLEGTVVKLK